MPFSEHFVIRTSEDGTGKTLVYSHVKGKYSRWICRSISHSCIGEERISSMGIWGLEGALLGKGEIYGTYVLNCAFSEHFVGCSS